MEKSIALSRDSHLRPLSVAVPTFKEAECPHSSLLLNGAHMKNYFKNIDIQCWEVTRLGVNPPFLCLQGNADAANLLLAAVDESSSEEMPTQRKLTLNPCKSKKSCSKIRLILTAENDELKEMSLKKDQDIAIFELTPTGLATFRDAVVIWRNGGEDFSIKPRKRLAKRDKESGEVWFWTTMEP